MKNYPVVLSATTGSIAPNRVIAPSDIRGLQNRTDHPLRIKEIRFNMTTGGVPGSNNDFWNFDVQFRIRNEPITAGFVPISAMTVPVDLSLDTEARGPENSEVHRPYLIQFSRPVILPPGEYIAAQVRNITRGGAVTTDMNIIAVCEDGSGIRESFLPWITHYLTPTRVDGTGIFEDISTESDLVNPFDDEMFVERLIGRIFWTSTSNESGSGLGRLQYDAIRVRIEDHLSTQIVRDATPFGVVFDRLYRSWKVNTTLSPKGFYRVAVESKLDPEVTGEIGGQSVFSIIGMLGYRKVR